MNILFAKKIRFFFINLFIILIFPSCKRNYESSVSDTEDSITVMGESTLAKESDVKQLYVPSVEELFDSDTVMINEATSDEISLWKRNIIQNGDVISYDNFANVMLDYPPNEFIYWAKYMAENFNHGPAYYDLYVAIIHSYLREGIKYENLNKETKEYLIQILKKGADKGDENAKIALKEIQQ